MYPAKISMPSNPLACARPAAATNPSISSSISARAHRVAAIGVVVGRQPRRRPVRRERVVGVAVLADVIQLVDHHDVRVGRPAGIGQPPECRDDRVVVVPEVAAGQDGGPVDRHGLHDDHPRATERALAVVADMALAGQPALGHVRGVRPERDPAGQRLVAQAERLEDVRRTPQAPVRRPASARATALDRPARRSRGRRPPPRRRRRRRIGQQRDHAADRCRGQDHQVDQQAERERVVARDAQPLGDRDDRQLECPDVARPGRDDRDQRDAARQQRGLAPPTAPRRPPGRRPGTCRSRRSRQAR